MEKARSSSSSAENLNYLLLFELQVILLEALDRQDENQNEKHIQALIKEESTEYRSI